MIKELVRERKFQIVDQVTYGEVLMRYVIEIIEVIRNRRKRGHKWIV